MIEAVTFDYWQTLVAERLGDMRTAQIDRFAATLAEASQARDRAELEASFAANWTRFERNWEENLGQYSPTDTVDFLLGRLGVDGSGGLRECLIDGFRVVGEGVPLRVAPGIEECLATLASAGVRLGIVCDVGLTSSPTLRVRLDGFGLLRYFEAWAFSDETGWFKPAAAAFEPALEGLGVKDPARVAHVGDNRRTDVAGALALGMVAVRYTGLGHDDTHAPAGDVGPEAPHVIADHRELPGILKIS
jgi:putative hydrolase of the HAD superfamily